jgi:hypothetical protein
MDTVVVWLAAGTGYGVVAAQQATKATPSRKPPLFRGFP